MQYKPEAVIASAIVVVMLSAFGTLTAFANPSGQGCAILGTCNPNTTPSGQVTGQKAGPTNVCPGTPTEKPGNAFNAGGSPFNPTGTAGGVYAGNPGTASQDHSNSGAAIAQYDRACTH